MKNYKVLLIIRNPLPTFIDDTVRKEPVRSIESFCQRKKIEKNVIEKGNGKNGARNISSKLVSSKTMKHERGNKLGM